MIIEFNIDSGGGGGHADIWCGMAGPCGRAERVMELVAYDPNQLNIGFSRVWWSFYHPIFVSFKFYFFELPLPST